MNQHQLASMSSRQKSTGFHCLLFGVTAVFFLFLGLILWFLDVGRWAFASSLLAVLCFDGLLWYGSVARSQKSFALKAGFIAMVIQTIMPVMMCFSVPFGDDYTFPWGEFIFQQPVEAAFSFLVAPVSVFLISILFSRSSSQPTKIDQIERFGFRFEVFLIIAALLKLVLWVAVLDRGNPIFYFARILAYALDMAPFFAGYFAFKFKKSTALWVVVMGLSLLASFYTGSRGGAFYPIIYFLIGFFLGLKTLQQKFKWGVAVGFPTVILMGIIGVYIGVARDVVGRTNLEGAISEGRDVVSASGDGSVKREILWQLQSGVAFKVFQRLTLWPIPVIPTMTPNEVPYRGFGDIGNELSAAFALGMIRGELNTGGIYFSNWFLRPYGFAVHADAYGQKSSVEMPVFTDAFTRGGWIAACVFVFMAYLYLYFAEYVLRRIFYKKHQYVFFAVLIVIATMSVVRVNVDPLIDLVRATILYGSFTAVVFVVVDKVLNAIGVRD